MSSGWWWTQQIGIFLIFIFHWEIFNWIFAFIGAKTYLKRVTSMAGWIDSRILMKYRKLTSNTYHIFGGQIQQQSCSNGSENFVWGRICLREHLVCVKDYTCIHWPYVYSIRMLFCYIKQQSKVGRYNLSTQSCLYAPFTPAQCKYKPIYFNETFVGNLIWPTEKDSYLFVLSKPVTFNITFCCTNSKRPRWGTFSLQETHLHMVCTILSKVGITENR